MERVAETAVVGWAAKEAVVAGTAEKEAVVGWAAKEAVVTAVGWVVNAATALAVA